MARKRSSFLHPSQSLLTVHLSSWIRFSCLLLLFFSLTFVSLSAQTQPPFNPQQLVDTASTLYQDNNPENDSNAISLLQTALTQYNQLQDPGGQALVLSNLSLLYQKQGHWDTAQQTLNQSLDLLTQQPQTVRIQVGGVDKGRKATKVTS